MNELAGNFTEDEEPNGVFLCLLHLLFLTKSANECTQQFQRLTFFTRTMMLSYQTFSMPCRRSKCFQEHIPLQRHFFESSDRSGGFDRWDVRIFVSERIRIVLLAAWDLDDFWWICDDLPPSSHVVCGGLELLNDWADSMQPSTINPPKKTFFCFPWFICHSFLTIFCIIHVFFCAKNKIPIQESKSLEKSHLLSSFPCRELLWATIISRKWRGVRGVPTSDSTKQFLLQVFVFSR